MLKRFGIDGFLLCVAAAIALALLFPRLGMDGGILPIDVVSRYGVSFVFFLYGLTLAPEKLRLGARRWPVHLVTQLSTFALFPLVVAVAGLGLAGLFPAALWFGFVYLAALSSTVSSSVAMTSMARGNVPLAVFNATASSLLGVFLTPLILALFMSATQRGLEVGPVILKVVLLVLLPIVLGQLLRAPLAGLVARYGKWLKYADRAVILAIIFGAMCNSTARGTWSSMSPQVLIGVIAAVWLLFALVYVIVDRICRTLRFTPDERIATLFCASTKSLASGVPLSGVILGDRPDLGLIITPLVIYHLSQLVIVTVLANRYAARPDPV